MCPFALHSAFIGPPGASAGVVEREVEDQFEDSEKLFEDRNIPLLEVDIPQEQFTMDEDATVSIRRFRFEGNTALSNQRLSDLLCCYEGRDLTMSDIREICRVIQKEYLCNGYFLARVFPPEQEIKKGVLRLEVIEGCLGEITVTGNEHYKTSFICSYFSRFQSNPINYDKFLETILLLNENEDLSVGAVFKKGSQYGTADLILQVVDHRPIHLYLNTNNYGSSFTTKQRTGARLDWGNLIVNGDKFRVGQVLGTPIKGLRFTDVLYKIPLTRRGTDLSLTYLYSDFDVNVMRKLDMSGRSSIAAGKIRQALMRTRCFASDVYLHFDYKQIKNFALRRTNSFDKLRNAGGALTFDYADSLWGRNIGEFHFVAGIPDILGGSRSVDPQSSRLGAGGKYWINYLDYTRLQTLFCDTYLMIQFHGQYSTFKLPLAEQIYLGGAEATRGYPVATVLGDKGYHGSVELRTAVPFLKNCRVPFSQRTWKDVLQLVFFYDRGQIWLNGGNTINQKQPITLNGAGLGFRIYGPWKFEFSFDIAFPLTSDRKTSDSISYFKVSWQPF